MTEKRLVKFANGHQVQKLLTIVYETTIQSQNSSEPIQHGNAGQFYPICKLAGVFYARDMKYQFRCMFFQ